MQRITDFFKTSLAGGLIVLLPLLLFFLLLSEIMGIIVALATPIADLFPTETFDRLSNPVFVAVLLLMGASFLLGLALRSNHLSRFGRFIERNTLMHLPLYNAIKGLSKGLIGAEGEDTFTSGLLTHDDGTKQLVYIIEEHPDGKVTVLEPMSPAGFTGYVKVVSPNDVVRLSASIGDTSRVIANWGVGMSEIMKTEVEEMNL